MSNNRQPKNYERRDAQAQSGENDSDNPDIENFNEFHLDAR
jgi:hypothetical protein